MRVLVQIAIAIAMLAVAAGTWWHFYGQPQAGAPPTAAAGGGSGGDGGFAVPVETAAVTVGPIERRITALGTLRSNESVVIRPEVSGRIAEIRFDEGERVRRGEPLVVLDDSVYRAELAQVEASLQLSRENYDRAVDLFERNAGTARARDEAVSRLRADEASMELARVRLDKTVIRAPFDGVVGLREVSVGDFVDVGQDIVRLEQIDPLKIDFRVSEIYLPAVATGQRLALTVDAYPDRAFEGQVYAIDPLIDVNGRSILLRARLPNQDGLLRPGLFARVTLVLNEKEGAFQVPEQALVPQGGEQYVFRVADGKAALTRVVPGIRRDGMVEITDGLGPDDTVITAGQIKVRDGAPVQPVTAAEQQPVAAAAPGA